MGNLDDRLWGINLIGNIKVKFGCKRSVGGLRLGGCYHELAVEAPKERPQQVIGAGQGAYPVQAQLK